MSKIQVNQLKAKLDQLYKGKIDLSDVTNVDDKEKFFLSRAYCAFALQECAEIESDIATNSIVDSFGDNGIDGIYYNEVTCDLWIIQSKWINAGTGEPDSGSIAKFVNGIRDIMEFKFDRFNDKIKALQTQIENAISDIRTKIKVVLAYTGSDHLADENYRLIKDLLEEINDASEVISFEKFTLKKAIQSLVNLLDGKPICIDLVIKNWGKVEEPYKAFIGLIDGHSLAQLWIDNRRKLLSENIREFIGNTLVNTDIKKTALESPELFFYYNNGVTVLCDSINKTAAGGSDHATGIFHIENMKIVNGAQTVGSLGEALLTNREALNKVYVFIKVISLDNCPQNFGEEVTKKTNTQNKIEKRDFVSLDVQHQRLQTELALQNITYYIRRTNTLSDSDSSCDVEDVITAVGCSLNDVDIAIYAKREVGKLWEKMDAAPYINIINGQLSGIRAWRCVQVMRRLESYIKEKERTTTGRRKSCYIHSNRFVLHMVLNNIEARAINDPSYNFEDYCKSLDSIFDRYEDNVFQIVERDYESSLMHQIFRNFTKTRDIKEKMTIR